MAASCNKDGRYSISWSEACNLAKIGAAEARICGEFDNPACSVRNEYGVLPCFVCSFSEAARRCCAATGVRKPNALLCSGRIGATRRSSAILRKRRRRVAWKAKRGTSAAITSCRCRECATYGWLYRFSARRFRVTAEQEVNPLR